jgi:hypothetical protein
LELVENFLAREEFLFFLKNVFAVDFSEDGMFMCPDLARGLFPVPFAPTAAIVGAEASTVSVFVCGGRDRFRSGS